MQQPHPGAGDAQAGHEHLPTLPVPGDELPPTPLQHAGVRHRPDWPFLYAWADGAFYLNRAPRKRRDLDQYGAAPW